ncbi:MAG: TlpA family protein disulfide reductase [Deltaproteobacteria bacterium]|nr:TlpA family protein disulfide reductase [Deltaproteobacteria bacterium]
MTRARLGTLLVLALVLVGRPTQAALPAPGAKAPAFALATLDDPARIVASRDLFRNATTLVSFFATWCEPCKKELGELKRLEPHYRAQGFQVALICLDIMGARNVKSYLEEAGALGLRVLTDRSGEASNRYGVVHLPTNVLVGADGTVISSWDTYRPDRLRELEVYLGRLPVRASAGTAPP